MATIITPYEKMVGDIFKRFCGDAQTKLGRNVRRSFPVHFYAGKNGGSKSFCAIYDTLPDLDAGIPVLSTVRLLDYKNPRPCEDPDCDDFLGHEMGHLAAHPFYVPFTSWPQLLDWNDGPVIMDEITGVADSNESAAMPSAAANKLAQLRRADCAVRITGLNFVRANKRIREAVKAVTRCSSILPVTSTKDDGSERMWKQYRFARWITYDSQSLPLDDISEAAYEKGDVVARARHWIPESPALGAYDTYAPVLMVGRVNESGRCVTCEGNRRPQECSCPDYVAAKTRSRSAGAQARSASTAGSATDFDQLPDGVSSLHLHAHAV